MVFKVQSHWLGTNLVIGIWVQNVGWQHGWASKIVIKSHPHPLPTAKAGHGHVDVRRVQLCYDPSDWLAVAMAAVFTLQLFLFCCCSFPCSFSSFSFSSPCHFTFTSFSSLDSLYLLSVSSNDCCLSSIWLAKRKELVEFRQARYAT